MATGFPKSIKRRCYQIRNNTPRTAVGEVILVRIMGDTNIKDLPPQSNLDQAPLQLLFLKENLRLSELITGLK